MNTGTRRVLVVLAIVGASFAGSYAPSENLAMAQTCDPSYPEICLPSAPDVDCDSIGIVITVIHDPAIGAFDPHYLDADFNGLGCELP
jgi:hypothetical protein